jgi:hypothetical protein
LPEDPRAGELDKMTPEVRREAERLLDDPNLPRRISEDVKRVGVVGEEKLALTLYLLGVSAQLAKPLSAILRGPTTSGKSFLLDRVSTLFPAEVALHATTLTANALYYFEPGALRHRFVVGGERKRLEDDDTAEATRALREMIEAGRLTKAVPMKNGAGEIVTRLIEQEGPIAYVESTTAGRIFDEDANRCLLLQTDERQEQTQRILRSTAAAAAGAAGLADVERVRLTHHAVQRMIPRNEILVPYAPAVAELFPTDRVDARRNFRHLVRLVEASALLHFRQRRRDPAGRVIATPADYALAAALADAPLGAAAGGASDGARRFLGRLTGWFPNK